MRNGILTSVLVMATTCTLPLLAEQRTFAGEQAAADVGADFLGESLQESVIWIPLPAQETPRAMCVAFRKQFTVVEEPAKAQWHIFADSRYLLWINGQYVLRGPSRFHPKRPEYDTVDLTKLLKKGSNCLAVLVQAGLSGRRFMKHAPGLAVRLEVEDATGAVRHLVTDSSWRASRDTRFLPPVNLASCVVDNRADA